MDTSKRYILMCKKAVEVQKLYWEEEWCKITEGDWSNDYIACKEHSALLRMGEKKPCPSVKGTLCLRRDNEVWLPRQDQLQEVVIEKMNPLNDRKLERNTAINRLLSEFWNNIGMYWNRNEYYWQFNSMEQLWLAFVIAEKYQKVWSTTKKDWIAQQAE